MVEARIKGNDRIKDIAPVLPGAAVVELNTPANSANFAVGQFVAVRHTTEILDYDSYYPLYVHFAKIRGVSAGVLPSRIIWKSRTKISTPPTYLGSFRRVHNAFPLMSNKGVYEHQRATTSDKRVFLLTRSSFLGQQRYASHSWSGDVVSTWEVMKKQLAAGLRITHYAAYHTGIPT